MNRGVQQNEPDPVEQSAAAWAVRHDRGMTAEEQDAFSQWLAADPRHRAAWAEYRWAWDELDRLAGLQASLQAVPDPDLLATKPDATRRRFRLRQLSLVLLGAVAAIALLAPASWRDAAPPLPAPANPEHLLTLVEKRELVDGSVVKLNRGAKMEVHFRSSERRVRLVQGEAHFDVAPDPSRPFVIEARGVRVRAVGTAFNVRLQPDSVEVLVTQGKVAVNGPANPTAATVGSTPRAELSGPVELSAGERTVVSLTSAKTCLVSPITPDEIEARLAWMPRLLDFTDAPLPDILAEFNRHNPVHLVLGDPSLTSLRLSATFRSDNVEGFVRLMVSNFGMRAQWLNATEIALTREK
jgi:transmembrane sensor